MLYYTWCYLVFLIPLNYTLLCLLLPAIGSVCLMKEKWQVCQNSSNLFCKVEVKCEGIQFAHMERLLLIVADIPNASKNSML